MYSHIQFNPPNLINWLVFDLDFEGKIVAPNWAREHWHDTCAPPPNIIVINKENGHAHYYYALDTPIARGDNARSSPIIYAKSVYNGIGSILKADPRYSQLVARNPLYPGHLTIFLHENLYTLADLDEYIWNRSAGSKWKQSVIAAGRQLNDAGRNCTIFDTVRSWAYQWVNEFDDFSLFQASILKQAEAANEFDYHLNGNLSIGEIRAIAKSIARWTWKYYGSASYRSSPSFKARQSARGQLKGSVRREQMLPVVLDLKAQGLSNREISRRIGVSPPTVGNWLKRVASQTV